MICGRVSNRIEIYSLPITNVHVVFIYCYLLVNNYSMLHLKRNQHGVGCSVKYDTHRPGDSRQGENSAGLPKEAVRTQGTGSAVEGK